MPSLIYNHLSSEDEKNSPTDLYGKANPVDTLVLKCLAVKKSKLNCPVTSDVKASLARFLPVIKQLKTFPVFSQNTTNFAVIKERHGKEIKK